MLNFKEQQNQLTYEKKIVLGALPFNNKIDGVQIDVCNVFIAAPLDASRGGIGFSSAKVKYGAAININRFNGIELPAALEVAFQTVASGSGKPQVVIKDIRVPKPSNIKE